MVLVVLDTNIIVSGILSPTGATRAILDLARSGRLDLVTSPLLLDELEDVLSRFFVRSVAVEIRVAFEELSHVVTPEHVPAVARDPDDDHALAAAVSGNAKLVITRDDDLLVLQEFHGIRIQQPATVLHLIRAQIAENESE